VRLLLTFFNFPDYGKKAIDDWGSFRHFFKQIVDANGGTSIRKGLDTLLKREESGLKYILMVRDE
jgi:hypothetical protein